MNIMKSPVEPKEELIITTDVNNISNLKLKENSYLLNHISKLAGNHDVKMSGTMIKVTYKKKPKDHFPSSACFNGNTLKEGSVLNDKSMDHSINKSDVCISQDKTKKPDVSKRSMCSTHGFVPKNKKSNFINKRGELPIIHSTPKIDLGTAEEKKRDYVNGLNLVMKLENDDLSVNRYHLKASHTINSHGMTTSNKNLSAKLTPIRASTSEKMLPSNIKFPKGITVIKLEENSNSKSGKLDKLTQGIKLKPEIKKTTVERNVVIKDNTKLKLGTKRKIKLEDDVAANKLMKKREFNKPQKFNISNKAANYSERECVEDLSKENFGKNASGSGKKELLMDDPDLPAGWKRVVITRYQGTPSQKHVVYIYSPLGKKFQFKWKLRKYLEKTKSALSAEQFHFGLYKRTKPLHVPTRIKDNSENVSLLIKAQLPKNEEQAISNINKSITTSEAKAFSLKNSKNAISNTQAKNRLNQYKDKLASKSIEIAQSSESDIAKASDADKRQLLLFDPDLPFGWKRIINSNNSSGKLQVYIISPEGRIFRRRYRLSEYLVKHQYTHSLDRFYFGLYPKRDLASSDGEVSNGGTSSKVSSTNGKHDNSVSIKAVDEEFDDDDSSSDRGNGSEELMLSEQDTSKFQQCITPMHDDPHLPEGWKRFIKMRSCGKSAGRMEAVIVSPDGRKLRTKRQLEHYLKRNNLSYDADSFDFSVFGRGKKRPQPVSNSKDLMENFKRRSKPPVPSDRPVSDLEMSELKDIEFTREGEMINAVNGIMIACELSSGRSERRLRLPRRDHEKLLKSYLDSENGIQTDDSIISPCWIQKLVKCRSDFRNLESDAECTIAEKTEEFLKELLIRAFQNREENSNMKLGYEDIANVVNRYECLSSLKTLIPKKITYKEYVKLNRPKQFMSFT